MLEDLFMTFIGISVTTSLVVLLLKLSAGFFNKTYAAKWKYWIWLVLALRLIIPFNFSFPSAPITVNITDVPIPAVGNAAPVQQIAQNDTAGTIQAVTHPHVFTLIDVLILIWVIGGVLFLVYQIVGYFVFRKKAVRWGKEPANARVKSTLHDVMADMGLKKEIAVLINENISSPLMTGFIKPLLILPNEEYSETDLNFILRHELTHYKRHDIWYKLLLIFVNARHWFNPVVYLLFREASADLELSCDDKVINGFSNAERRAYSETILASITAQKSLRMALSTYFYEGERTMKSRFSNIFNSGKKRNGAFVLLVVILAVGVLGSAVACDVDTNEDKILKRLGYTRAFLDSMESAKTTFSEDNENIERILKSLPQPDYREYKSFSQQAEPLKEINIIYEINDNYTRGGNGIDPYYDIVWQNNALILFALVGGLEKVNFLSYDNQELNRTDSYTLGDLAARFGDIKPPDMSFSDLDNALGTNIFLSEFYFAHYSRIYLGGDTESVSYRNGEPGEVIQKADGSTIWIYPDFDTIYNTSPYGSVNPESTAVYYFDSPQAESDNLYGLYATKFICGDNYGKTYDDITELFGGPAVIKNMGGGNKYVAYPLAAEHKNTNAYFILHDDKVIEEGVMYGNDYTVLD